MTPPTPEAIRTALAVLAYYRDELATLPPNVRKLNRGTMSGLSMAAIHLEQKLGGAA